MFVGSSDELATVDDCRWAKTQMEKVMVHYKEYPLGHLSFMVAKDMSYFNDVLSLISQHSNDASETDIIEMPAFVISEITDEELIQ